MRGYLKHKIQDLSQIQIIKRGWFRVEKDTDEVLLVYVSERAIDDKTKRKAFLKYIEECDDEWFEGQNHYIEVIGGEVLTMIVQTSGTGSPNECPPGVDCRPVDPDAQ